MQKQNYAKVVWTIEDVIENSNQFEIQITKDAAKRVLAHEERRIVDAMVKAGWQVIEESLMQV